MVAIAESGDKAARLCAHLRQRILVGGLRPGVPLPTQRQLAEQFQIGEGTASVALARLVHEGLVIRQRGRGSFVNANLPTAQRTIEFIRERCRPGDTERPADRRWIVACTEFSHEKGWSARWHHLYSEEITDPQFLLERFADARAVVAFQIAQTHLGGLHERGVAVVAVPTNEGLPLAPYSQVTHDRREIARIAATHLAQLGHRRIAFFGLATSPERLYGFMDAARQRDLPLRAEWLIDVPHGRTSPDVMRERVKGVLSSRERPEAFCCASHRLALVVEEVALELGLRIPEDLAVVSADNGMGAFEPVPLTCVGIDVQHLCELTLDLLEQATRQGGGDSDEPRPPVMVPIATFIAESCGARLKKAEF